MADIDLYAEKRTKEGRHTRNQLAKEGRIPGVMYGREVGSMALAVDAAELKKILKNFGTSSLINLKFKDEKKNNNYKVMVRDLQHDPVRNEIMHVDFQKISMADKIKTSAKIKLTGKPDLPSGMTVQQQRTVEIECLPSKIPGEITVDISDINEGEVLHVGDLQPPEGVKITTDPGTVIASAAYLKTIEPEETPEEIKDKDDDVKEDGNEGEGFKQA